MACGKIALPRRVSKGVESTAASVDGLRHLATGSIAPANIYRCKGVIYSAEIPDRRAILQVVGKRVHISIENEWGSRVPRSQIVAIGAHTAIDGDQLRSLFEHCLAEP